MEEQDNTPPTDRTAWKAWARANVGPTFRNIQEAAINERGELDLDKFACFEGRYGGKCDVRSGPCACGAWHEAVVSPKELPPKSSD